MSGKNERGSQGGWGGGWGGGVNIHNRKKVALDPWQ